VDTTKFDSLTKDLGTGTTRRRAIAGLGALALGGAGFLGLARGAAADNRRQCIERCVDNAPKSKRARDRCRRRCENR
jgi:hypothetical protein